MKLNYQELIPQDFSDNSRVFIYQSNRLFSIPEAIRIEDMLNDFTSRWNSHGDPVKGYANLFFGQFIVFIADESQVKLGGCSTDSSIHVVKEIEKLFQVSMFDRMALAFIVKEKVQLIPMNQLQYAVDNGFISGETLYFNNTIQTKADLLNNWLIPVKESWLGRRVSLAI